MRIKPSQIILGALIAFAFALIVLNGCGKCYGQESINSVKRYSVTCDTAYAGIHALKIDTIAHDIQYDTASEIFLVSDTNECNIAFVKRGFIVHKTEYVLTKGRYFISSARYYDSDYFYDENYCKLEDRYIIWNHKILSK